MKNLFLVFVVFMMTILSSSKLSAQEKNFFVGEWKVVVKGTPKGDNTMLIVIDQKDGKFTAKMLDPVTEKETNKFSRIEVKDEEMTLHFTTQGFEAYLFLEKKDENNIEGSLIDMFDATGTRFIREKK